MKEFLIKSIDASVSYDGSEVHIGLSLYPTELDGNQALHEACIEHKPIYILTQEEFDRLMKAKHRLEDLEW